MASSNSWDDFHLKMDLDMTNLKEDELDMIPDITADEICKF